MNEIIDRRNVEFTLYELLEAEGLNRYQRYAEHGRETFDAAIETAHAIARDKFQPHNRKNDLNEPELVDGKVQLIPEVKDALDAFIEAGFLAATRDYDDGGMQLPAVVAQVCNSMFQGANIGTSAYTFLAAGVAHMLEAHASEEQQRKYMDPIYEGRFFGTMALSEPHAGSSLADIKTRAEPTDEGHYLLSGAKMWISGGDQEISENIIHMVLAKIPGGPPGVKGISMFIVPKYLVNDDGSLGERNDWVCAGLNHKMGYRGTTNTFLKFGEKGQCVGYLVGEEHKGLSYMFHMMNGARIGVGMGAVMLGYGGYMASLDYARERPQGRHPDQKDPASKPVPIIEHADVRRMLLAQKAYVEGGYALGLYCSQLTDIQHQDPDPAERERAHLLLEMLTPVMKAWPSDYCLKANDMAIQVHGGYGYTREYPVEQFYRDNRLNPIHEGTNGIQGLDLLGRKMMMKGGEGLKLLGREMQATIGEAAEVAELKEYAEALGQSLHRIGKTVEVMGARMAGGDIRLGLANATLFLELTGHTIIAWIWLKQALTAHRGLARAGEADQAFYQGKLQACRYFFRYELPLVQPHAELLQAMDDTTLAMQDKWF